MFLNLMLSFNKIIVCLPAEFVNTSMLHASGLCTRGGGGGLSIKQFGYILRLIFDPILTLNSRGALKAILLQN